MPTPEPGHRKAADETVEVVYALSERQTVVTLAWQPAGMTAGEAIDASGLCERFPELDRGAMVIGLFGTVCDLHRPLQPGDRVEIYRPLRHDPREMRRTRVAQSAQKNPGRRSR